MLLPKVLVQTGRALVTILALLLGNKVTATENLVIRILAQPNRAKALKLASATNRIGKRKFIMVA